MGQSNSQSLLSVTRGIRTTRRLPHRRGYSLECPRPEADSRSWTRGQMLRLPRAASGMPAVELGRLVGLRSVYIGARLPPPVLPHGRHARRPQVSRPRIDVSQTRAVTCEAKRDRAVVSDLTASKVPRMVR